MSSILLIGGGGHCAACIDVLESSGIWTIAGIIDRPEKVGAAVLGYPIIGTDIDLPSLKSEYFDALITLGQISSSSPRLELYEALLRFGFRRPVVVASSAYVSRFANIGQGTVVMHRSVVNARAIVGENCIINTGAIIEHDVVVGCHCHISTAAVVNGSCSVGDSCFIGSGAVLRNGVAVPRGTIVGAGATVIKNIEEPGVYIGCPARKIR